MRSDDRSCASALRVGQLEHAHEHRRHQLAVGDAVLRRPGAGTRSASKCSITTTVPPRRITAMQKRSGAAWYSGAGRQVDACPAPMPNGPMHSFSSELTQAMSVGLAAARTRPWAGRWCPTNRACRRRPISSAMRLGRAARPRRPRRSRSRRSCRRASAACCTPGVLASSSARLAGHRLRGDEHLGAAVVDDVGRLAGGQAAADGGVDEPGALRAPSRSRSSAGGSPASARCGRRRPGPGGGTAAPAGSSRRRAGGS